MRSEGDAHLDPADRARYLPSSSLPSEDPGSEGGARRGCRLSSPRTHARTHARLFQPVITRQLVALFLHRARQASTRVVAARKSEKRAITDRGRPDWNATTTSDLFLLRRLFGSSFLLGGITRLFHVVELPERSCGVLLVVTESKFEFILTRTC